MFFTPKWQRSFQSCLGDIAKKNGHSYVLAAELPCREPENSLSTAMDLAAPVAINGCQSASIPTVIKGKKTWRKVASSFEGFGGRCQRRQALQTTVFVSSYFSLSP